MLGTVSTSSTMGWKDVNRRVQMNIEQVRLGLYCVHCRWTPPISGRRTPERRLANGSVCGDENADLRSPSQSVNSDGYSCTGSSLQQPELSPLCGAPSASLTNDTASAGLAQASEVFATPMKTSNSSMSKLGTSCEKLPQQLQTVDFGVKPLAGSSGSSFASPVDGKVRGFENPNPLVNTAAGAFDNTNNQPAAKKETMEYVAGLKINKTPVEIKASFTKSTGNVVGFLALTQIETEPRLCTEIDKISCEFSRLGGVVENSNIQLPYAVWANVDETEKKTHNLKFSNSHNCWMSDEFNGSFACFTSLTAGSFVAWKPLTCLIYFQFENISSVGEKNALKQLADLHNTQTYCDVQFSLKGDQHIGGHRNILAARSRVFAAMFQHNMKEAITGQVNIEDSEPDIFKQLLHYIYSGRISTPLTDAIAQPLFVAADKYNIKDLKKECATFLLTCVRMDNVVGLLVWAHLHSVNALKEVTLTFVAHNAKDICRLKDWEELTKNYPDLCILATRRIMGCD